MKKFLIFGTLFIVGLFSLNAQGIYLDIGFGIGGAWTKLDDTDVSSTLGGSGVKEIGVDLDLKAGYGPIANIPLYIVGTIGSIGHRLDDGSNFIQFNSYIVGPGVIFYPIPLIQLAGSFGYSFVGNQTSISGLKMAASKVGFAGDVSAAIDLGGNNNGFLIGARYFVAINTLETDVKQNSSVLSVFVRYAYRQKLK